MRIISKKQNQAAAAAFNNAVAERFSDAGIAAEIRAHRSGKEYDFVHIDCPPRHWPSLAKWLRFDQRFDYLGMISGVHYPLEFSFHDGTPPSKPGSEEKGWEVTVHLTRKSIIDARVGESIVLEPSTLEGMAVPLELQVTMTLPQTDEPSVPSVQHIWEGADWNEKETWDLLGIDFEGHEGMMRVLNPHDSPAGFHPLQKQFKIRYHNYNEMYDDPQGFGRKPTDSGLKK